MLKHWARIIQSFLDFTNINRKSSDDCVDFSFVLERRKTIRKEKKKGNETRENSHMSTRGKSIYLMELTLAFSIGNLHYECSKQFYFNKSHNIKCLRIILRFYDG